MYYTPGFAPYTFFLETEHASASRNANTPASPACESRPAVYSQQTTDTETILQVELPGVHKQNVSVEVNGQKLTLTGKRYRPQFSVNDQAEQTEPESPTKKPKTDHSDDTEPSREAHVKNEEKPTVVYKRTFVLARNIDTDAVKAQDFSNGVLSLVLPKKKDAASRKIFVE